jgi:hypothetical protein
MKVEIRARIKWLEKMVDELYKNLEDMKWE